MGSNGCCWRAPALAVAALVSVVLAAVQALAGEPVEKISLSPEQMQAAVARVQPMSREQKAQLVFDFFRGFPPGKREYGFSGEYEGAKGAFVVKLDGRKKALSIVGQRSSQGASAGISCEYKADGEKVSGEATMSGAGDSMTLSLVLTKEGLRVAPLSRAEVKEKMGSEEGAAEAMLDRFEKGAEAMLTLIVAAVSPAAPAGAATP